MLTIPNRGKSHHLSKPVATGLERELASGDKPPPEPTEGPWPVVEAGEALGFSSPREEGLELRALPFFFFQSEKQPSGGFFFQALGKFF